MEHDVSAIAALSVILGTDASGFDPDGQLPPIPETNASKSGRQRLVDLAARDKLTVRQLAQRVGGYGGGPPFGPPPPPAAPGVGGPVHFWSDRLYCTISVFSPGPPA